MDNKLLPPSARGPWGPLLWIWLLGSLIYLRSLGFGYVFFDDHYLILEQQHFLRNISNIKAVFFDDVFRSNYDSYYRPILTLSFMVDAWVGGTNPVIYHLSSVLLHLISSTGVWFLFKRLQLPPTTAFLLALLFTIHPVHSQSNYWIPGRNDPLMGIFAIAAVIFFLDYLKRPSRKLYALHSFSWLLALFCKETALFLILIFLLYGYLFSVQRRLLLRFVPAWVLGLAGWLTIKSIAFAYPIPLKADIMLAALNRAWPALIQFFGKAVLPLNLAVLPTIEDTTLGWGIASAILIAWLIYKNPTRDMKKIGFGIGWFLILLVPTFLRPEIESQPYFLETRMYLPVIGILLLISETGWGQSILNNKRNASIYAVILLLFSAVHLVHARNFKDRVAYWEFAVASSPSLPMARQNLGAIYIMEGDLDRAESVIKEAIALRPRSSLAYNNLGVIYLNRGQFDLAEEALKKSLEVDPRYDDAAYLLGLLYYQTGQTEKAKATWEGTLNINPCHPQTLTKLALLAHNSQDEETLRRYVQKLRRLNYPLPNEIHSRSIKKDASSD